MAGYVNPSNSNISKNLIAFSLTYKHFHLVLEFKLLFKAHVEINIRSLKEGLKPICKAHIVHGLYNQVGVVGHTMNPTMKGAWFPCT
jgi:hypothetical protein